MKEADKHRVQKALASLEQAKTHLRNIKWENISSRKDVIRMKAIETIAEAKDYCNDIINAED